MTPPKVPRERPKRSPPGAALIRLFAALVPDHSRDEWKQEWESELINDLEERIARGESERAARLILILRSVAAVRDAVWLRRRELRYGEGMIGQDLRYTLRAAGRRPGFSLMLTLTLALGIGATTAIFSVVDAVLLHPAPFRDAERLAEVLTYLPKYDLTADEVIPEVARFWEGQKQLFDRVERFDVASRVLTGVAEPRRLLTARVTPGLLELLGVQPIMGRLFGQDESLPGAPEVAVISESLWRSALGGARDAIGQTIKLDDQVVTVVGVMPKWFRYPAASELMLPWRNAPRSADGAEERYNILARLADTREPALSQAQVDAIARRMNLERPRENGALWNVKLRHLGYSTVRAETRTLLWVLAGAVLCVLLIACVNAANLLLAQGNARQRELAIRAALGAGRGRLIRQLLTESAAFSLLSGGLGLLIAYWGLKALIAIMPREITLRTYTTIGLDQRVLLFSLALTVLTGIAFGLVPALRASRQQSQLGHSERASTGGQADVRVRRAFVVVEFALAMMLLVGAGLLINSFARLARVDLGIDAEHLLTIEPVLLAARYRDEADATVVVTRLVERLRALPGVRGLTVTANAPPDLTYFIATALQAEGAAPLPGDRRMIPATTADTTYFATLGIPMLAGRAFNASDVKPGSSSVIIDPDLAVLLWGSTNPLGKRFRTSPKSEWYTVVGVAADTKLIGPDDRRAELGLYLPISLDQLGRFSAIILRSHGDPEVLIPSVHKIARDVDPDLPLERVVTLEKRFAVTTMKPKFVLTLMSIFAGVALILAVIGIYGQMAYAVSLRTREIGVRMALGARSSEILGRVFGEGMTMTLVGGLIGLAAAFALARFLESMLFGVKPGDPATILVVGLTLPMVSAAAALVPAWRASRVSPMAALSSE